MTIKKKDIRRIARDYQLAFPNWQFLEPGAIARVSGPVLQGIVFDRSARDIYRPTGYIRVLTVPKSAGIMELPQQLTYPNGAPQREVKLSNHEKERAEIIQELYRQIWPRLDRSLDPLEVLEVYERKAIPKTPEAYSLAALCAYLGYESRARDWIRRFRELDLEWEKYWMSDPKRKKYRLSEAGQKGRQPYLERTKFVDNLEKWLDKGKAKQELERVIEQELNKLGLVLK
jgi:hypothetical protein